MPTLHQSLSAASASTIGILTNRASSPSSRTAIVPHRFGLPARSACANLAVRATSPARYPQARHPQASPATPVRGVMPSVAHAGKGSTTTPPPIVRLGEGTRMMKRSPRAATSGCASLSAPSRSRQARVHLCAAVPHAPEPLPTQDKARHRRSEPKREAPMASTSSRTSRAVGGWNIPGKVTTSPRRRSLRATPPGSSPACRRDIPRQSGDDGPAVHEFAREVHAAAPLSPGRHADAPSCSVPVTTVPKPVMLKTRSTADADAPGRGEWGHHPQLDPVRQVVRGGPVW